MSPERADELSARAEKLGAIAWTLTLTGMVLLMAAYFDFPWMAGIGLQVLCMAVVVGGILLYGKVKARNSADRYDEKG